MFVNYLPAARLLQAAKLAVNSPSAVSLEALSLEIKAADAEIQQAEALDAEIEKAREIFETDDIEIDDSPAVSVADDGVWVSAWVWVPSRE